VALQIAAEIRKTRGADGSASREALGLDHGEAVAAHPEQDLLE
jgi:hypothetical protein